MSVTLADRYLEGFLKQSVGLINLGYTDARGAIFDSVPEEVITDRITRAAQKRLIEGQVPAPMRRLAISDDAKVSNGQREGKRRRRIDIRVESTAIAGRPTLEVEAKCLKQSSHPISGYTGSEGLMLFVNSEYAQDCSFGAMLGYVQSNSPEHWSSQLASDLAQKRSQNGLKGDCEMNSTFAFTQGHLSRHSRESRSEIKMYHFMLDCC